MAGEVELRIKVNPSNGSARVVGRGASTTTTSSATSDPTQASGQDLARMMVGGTQWAVGGGVPWYLDPTTVRGSAARALASSEADPLASGAQVASTREIQAARLGTYEATYQSRYASAFATTGDASAADQIAEKFATAAANAMGAAMEKLGQRNVMTSGAATNTVQSVLAQYARARLSGQFTDEDIQTMLERETLANQRAYDAQVRVAALSGNGLAASSVAGAQLSADSARSYIDESIWETERRRAEQEERGRRSAGGAPVHR